MTDLLTRRLELDFRAADADARTVPAVVSTEAPVDRGGYREILSHEADAVDLSRAPLPLIESHNAGTVNIGLVDGLQLVSGKLRGLVRFGKSKRATELLEDVKAGIVCGLSIGYQILDHREDGDTITALRWQPFEVSAVAVPADIGAGFFRSNAMQNEQTPSRAERRREQSADKRIAEAERRSDILAMGIKFKQTELAEQYADSGKPVEDFQAAVLERMGGRPIQAGPSSALDVDLTNSEAREFSFIRAARYLSNPNDRKTKAEAAFELEVTEASQRDFAGPGIHVPGKVLTRDLTVGGTNYGSALKGTDHLGSQFIDLLRAELITQELGATFLSGLRGDVAIPRQSGTSTAYWVAENGAVTESNQTFDQVTLQPRTVGTFTDLSRKLLIQSDPSAEMLVRRDFAQMLARELDRVALSGNPDVTASANEPRGIIYTSGIGSVAGGTNGAAPTRDNLIDLWSACAIANADRGALAYCSNAAVAAKLMKTNLDTGSGRFVLEGREFNGFNFHVSNTVPSDLDKGTSTGVCSAIIFGNWADLVIGQWSGLDILSDPYTGGAKGALRLIVLQDVDCVTRHPASFAAQLDALTS